MRDLERCRILMYIEKTITFEAFFNQYIMPYRPHCCRAETVRLFQKLSLSRPRCLLFTCILFTRFFRFKQRVGNFVCDW